MVVFYQRMVFFASKIVYKLGSLCLKNELKGQSETKKHPKFLYRF